MKQVCQRMELQRMRFCDQTAGGRDEPGGSRQGDAEMR
jgi:hypothetical protein